MIEYPSREEKYRISDAEWDQGWRYKFRDAVDKALQDHPDGTEARIDQILVKKRGDRSFHDYKIVLGGG
ncbi:MAG TPA: hypothetical protein VFL41_04310 [Gaiellaceae bacterium]|nr:hypothetical protein [Gaiellaceae bacterium]HET8653769.1 hypothetical protein [Gaiellaceae bacterium]